MNTVEDYISVEDEEDFMKLCIDGGKMDDESVHRDSFYQEAEPKVIVECEMIWLQVNQ